MVGGHDVTVHATQALAPFVALKCSDLQGPQEASCLSGVNKTSGNGKRATNLFFYKHIRKLLEYSIAILQHAAQTDLFSHTLVVFPAA